MKSKSVKKSSDVDRSRKRKSKSRKTKCNYSSSSDSANTHKKKRPNKTKESKKRIPRKKSRSTSPSSSSGYSTDSCSTCEKQNPKKKTKLRKNSLSSGLKYKGRERGRSLKRSRSCSTCSSISRSPSRGSRSFRKEKREKVEGENIPKDKVILAYDDFASSSKYNKKREKVESARIPRRVLDNEEMDRDRDREREDREPIFEMREKHEVEKTHNEGTKKEGAVDVELVLRQKALENFIKFHKFKKFSNGDETEKLGSNELSKETGSVIISDGRYKPSKEIGSVDMDERYQPILNESTEEIDEDLKGKEQIVSDLSVKRPRIRSVISIPIEAENSEVNTIIESCDKNDDSHPNPHPNPNPDPNSSKFETKREGEEKLEGEFQNKTFSRMHDGEMVEVSYKVYIPKRAPALARRKLIR